jgi:hypothetical protein
MLSMQGGKYLSSGKMQKSLNGGNSIAKVAVIVGNAVIED